MNEKLTYEEIVKSLKNRVEHCNKQIEFNRNRYLRTHAKAYQLINITVKYERDAYISILKEMGEWEDE